DRPRIKRDIPVILLGQLGVDLAFQGNGYGEYLLMDAQARVSEISKRTGVRGLVLDARTESLVSWYERHDFVRFPGRLRMYKSIDLIHKLELTS
ncbi:MAG TPA: GNAT family N-acetyltransferase, partial [Blastocatellia bacterium]|nr:GNAT family N-acetyltransferase [Blastocatellia bacterium]